MTVRPKDVVRAAVFLRDSLEPGIDTDWSVRAARLEWDVGFTISHLTGAAAKYTLYLASRSTKFLAVRTPGWPDATHRQQLDAIVIAATGLANVAEAAPPGTRAFHATAMFDVEGYCAMACFEMLVHGYDAASGLRLPFDPPDDLVRAVVDRLFPWLADDTEPAWRALLWHTGRLDLPGRESHDDDAWTLLRGTLDEWDGEIPVQNPGTVVEWVLEEGSWRPVYLAEDP